MHPLVVTVELASPVLDAHDPIHLDGIVVQAQARRHGLETPDRVSSLADLPVLSIPLATLRVMEATCAVCSAAEPLSPVAPAAVHQAKRRDVEDWDRLALPVNVASGPGKDRLERNLGQVAFGLRWYTWGYRAAVMDLLRLLWGHPDRPRGFIGSKRRSGSGELSRWSIDYGDHEPERCLVRDGMAARHLPASWVLTAGRWRTGAYAPPYWHPDRRGPVPWLGVPVELRPEVHAALTDLGCR